LIEIFRFDVVEFRSRGDQHFAWRGLEADAIQADFRVVFEQLQCRFGERPKRRGRIGARVESRGVGIHFHHCAV